ncbi:MAG: hypothetical protein ACRDLQ_08625 [Solirubrobacterales bacterium]
MSAGPSQVVVGYDGSDRVPPELKYYEFFQDVLADLERGAQEIVESARDAFEGADLEQRRAS